MITLLFAPLDNGAFLFVCRHSAVTARRSIREKPYKQRGKSNIDRQASLTERHSGFGTTFDAIKKFPRKKTGIRGF